MRLRYQASESSLAPGPTLPSSRQAVKATKLQTLPTAKHTLTRLRPSVQTLMSGACAWLGQALVDLVSTCLQQQYKSWAVHSCMLACVSFFIPASIHSLTYSAIDHLLTHSSTPLTNPLTHSLTHVFFIRHLAATFGGNKHAYSSVRLSLIQATTQVWIQTSNRHEGAYQTQTM